MDSRVITSYIRGLAIAAVIFAHFLQYFHPDFFYKWVAGYARGLVAVFFVLSGLGIYHLFERLSATETSRTALLLKYLSGRALRIYPLFWIALLLTPLVLHSEYARLQELSLGTVAVFLGVPTEGIGIFWFVAALIECYVAAPFLYALLKRIGPSRYLLAMLALGAALFAVTCVIAFANLYPIYDQSNFFYRYLLLGNIVLFALGMAIPPIVSEYRERLASGTALFGAAVLLVVSLSFTRVPNMLVHHLEILVAPLLVLSAFAICLFAVTSVRQLPLKSVICLSGEHSYSLYLFHMFFFGVLTYVGLVEAGSLGGDVITIVLLPVLLVFCIGIERLADSGRVRIGGVKSPAAVPVKPSAGAGDAGSGDIA